MSVAASNARANVDSFFDIVIDLMEAGQIDFQATAPTTYPTSGFDTEMISMNLRSSSTPRVNVSPIASDGSFQVDSFFDITYQAGPSGGPHTVDSFFDVFTEISVIPTGTDPKGAETFDTEILSLSLSGSGGTNPITLSPSLDHRGHVTVLKIAAGGGGGEFHIDSFFDVFTEISIDGGNTFTPAASSTPLAFSTVVTPEPSTCALFAVFGLLSICQRRSGRNHRRY